MSVLCVRDFNKVPSFVELIRQRFEFKEDVCFLSQILLSVKSFSSTYVTFRPRDSPSTLPC